MRRPTLSILAVVLSTACGPGPEAEPPGPKLGPADLDQLNQELANTYHPLTRAEMLHFAPLCDDRGYPLVGNIASKSNYTASEVCTALRGEKK